MKDFLINLACVPLIIIVAILFLPIAFLVYLVELFDPSHKSSSWENPPPERD